MRNIKSSVKKKLLLYPPVSIAALYANFRLFSSHYFSKQLPAPGAANAVLRFLPFGGGYEVKSSSLIEEGGMSTILPLVLYLLTFLYALWGNKPLKKPKTMLHRSKQHMGHLLPVVKLILKCCTDDTIKISQPLFVDFLWALGSTVALVDILPHFLGTDKSKGS